MVLFEKLLRVIIRRKMQQTRMRAQKSCHRQFPDNRKLISDSREESVALIVHHTQQLLVLSDCEL